ncbi:hypothetical protein EX30DRAFT_166418 [Ascodesmis nigricans]|uniref:Uncharacterized protein n=1 Tax=Ascodesmis nigricans TaxID=341454 RepID=A0A4S2MRZ0_9PEZI|nr:hypothetical protein EX30DRAFT_166418 [Ascodesmis nigricans]
MHDSMNDSMQCCSHTRTGTIMNLNNPVVSRHVPISLGYVPGALGWTVDGGGGRRRRRRYVLCEIGYPRGSNATATAVTSSSMWTENHTSRLEIQPKQLNNRCFYALRHSGYIGVLLNVTGARVELFPQWHHDCDQHSRRRDIDSTRLVHDQPDR